MPLDTKQANNQVQLSKQTLLWVDASGLNGESHMAEMS